LERWARINGGSTERSNSHLGIFKRFVPRTWVTGFLTPVTSLDLSGCDLDDDRLILSLGNSNTIEHLDISNNPRLTHLVEPKLQSLDRLKTIKLENTSLTNVMLNVNDRPVQVSALTLFCLVAILYSLVIYGGYVVASQPETDDESKTEQTMLGNPSA